MAIFGQNADFVYLFNNNQINFESLKSIKNNETQEPVYKEDTYNDTQLHLLRVSDSKPENPDSYTFALFEYNDHQVLSSSISAAREFIDAQNSSDALKFPKSSPREASLIVEYYNDKAISKQFLGFLLNEGQIPGASNTKIVQFLEKINDATFVLKTDTFSGLINLK